MISPLTDDLIEAVVRQLAINPRGLHGLSHWARVYANGMRLAQDNGADIDVVELFALFHDSRRLTENADPEHGPRGADLAQQLHGSLFTLDEEKMELLLTACRLHTAARTHDHVTVQTCFDADRLDLARIGKIVDPHYLCTPVAKVPQTIAWANTQSRCHVVPDNPLGRFFRRKPEIKLPFLMKN
jgi:uncharacterized protein